MDMPDKVVVTDENWPEFKAAVEKLINTGLTLEICEQYETYRILDACGFRFSREQGFKVLREVLMPKILAKIPDAEFKMTIYWAFSIRSERLWNKACAEAEAAWGLCTTPYTYKNVPVVQLP